MIYCFEQISFKPIGHPLEDDNKEKIHMPLTQPISEKKLSV
jgi:hypothetical protein